MRKIKTYQEMEEKTRRDIEEGTLGLKSKKEIISKINNMIADTKTILSGSCAALGEMIVIVTLLLDFFEDELSFEKVVVILAAIMLAILIIIFSLIKQPQMKLLALEEIKKEYEQKEDSNDNEQINSIIKRERLTSIHNMIDLGLTKDQILRKYTEEEYAQAESSLLVHS